MTAVGAKGVECFFILSGFLAFQSLEKSDNVQAYWIKRAVHIIPIYCIVLIAQQLFDIFYAHFFQGQSWISILSWGGIGGLQNIRFLLLLIWYCLQILGGSGILSMEYGRSMFLLYFILLRHYYIDSLRNFGGHMAHF